MKSYFDESFREADEKYQSEKAAKTEEAEKAEKLRAEQTEEAEKAQREPRGLLADPKVE